MTVDDGTGIAPGLIMALMGVALLGIVVWSVPPGLIGHLLETTEADHANAGGAVHGTVSEAVETVSGAVAEQSLEQPRADGTQAVSPPGAEEPLPTTQGATRLLAGEELETATPAGAPGMMQQAPGYVAPFAGYQEPAWSAYAPWPPAAYFPPPPPPPPPVYGPYYAPYYPPPY